MIFAFCHTQSTESIVHIDFGRQRELRVVTSRLLYNLCECIRCINCQYSVGTLLAYIKR